MHSDDGEFWDLRFRAEGEIWGNAPSATAILATQFLPPPARVLEVGYGYGRDLVYLIRQGYRVTGIDLSREGQRHAKDWLERDGLREEALLLGRFENADFAVGSFDMLVCHRVAHLMVTTEAIDTFVRKASQVLRPGGILCVGARNSDTVNFAEMVLVENKVYEYAHRPGHRIRFWDDDAFHDTFGAAFTIETLTRALEPESVTKPIPCHLTIMAAKKK